MRHIDQSPNTEPCIFYPVTVWEEEILTSAHLDTPPEPEVYLLPSLGYLHVPPGAEVHMPVPAPILLSEGTHRKIQKAAPGKQFPLFQMDAAFSQHRVQGDTGDELRRIHCQFFHS